MSPKRKPTHRVTLTPAYVAELRARVNAIGFREVARTANMGLATLWRVLSVDADQPPTLDAAERVRAAIAKADPNGPAMPPPVIAVLGSAHAAWCALGAELAQRAPEALAAAMAAPAALRAQIIAAAATKARPGRKRPR